MQKTRSNRSWSGLDQCPSGNPDERRRISPYQRRRISPYKTLAVFDSDSLTSKKAFFVLARTVWRPAISGLPSAAPKGARTVWRPAISGLPSAAPKGARKELALSPAKGGVARRRTYVPPRGASRPCLCHRRRQWPNRRAVPPPQGEKGPFPDGN